MDQNKLLNAMIAYDGGDAERIQHFIKVYGFAKMIGEQEGLDQSTQQILETAAIVHDIGIHPAEAKYGSCRGDLQEQEGPPEAEKMLTELGYERSVVDRVCYLVGHHHTYTDVDGMDYQILIEADFLVNFYEGGSDRETIETTLQKIFRTAAGKDLCRVMFGI